MPHLKTIKLSKSIHHEQDVVVIRFEYDLELIGALKQVSGARWSKTMNCWYIPEKQFDLHNLFEAFKNLAFVDYSVLKSRPAPFVVKNKKVKTYPHRKLIELPKGYLEKLEQKRYSDSTIRTYCSYFKDFMHHF